MKQIIQSHVIGELDQACARHPAHHLAPTFLKQGEFVTLSHFVPQGVIEQFMEEVERVRPQLHRNYIPTHKKGGSVSYYLLRPAEVDFVFVPITGIYRVAQPNRRDAFATVSR